MIAHPKVPRPITSVQILKGFRSLGGPVPRKGRGVLSFDPAFHSYIRFWVMGPTLDAARDALEVLKLIGIEIPADILEASRQFLLDHYDRKSGNFFTNDPEYSSGLYSLHAAISIIKILAGIPKNKPMDETLIGRALSSLGLDIDLSGATLGLLRSCTQASSIKGGIVDSPKMSRPIPSITALHLSSALLWSIFGSNARREANKIIPMSDLATFLTGSLWRRVIGKRDVAAFTLNPTSTELCTNSTYFGLMAIHRAGLFDQIVTREIKERIIDYLVFVAWCGSGFRSTLHDPPSLNATFFGLKSLEFLDKAIIHEFVEENYGPLRRFLETCEQQGGFMFTLDSTRYVENPLATRYYLETRGLLARYGCELDADVDKISGFIRYRVVDTIKKEFRAYPERRIKIGKEVLQSRNLAESAQQVNGPMFLAVPMDQELRSSRLKLNGRLEQVFSPSIVNLGKGLFRIQLLEIVLNIIIEKLGKNTHCRVSWNSDFKTLDFGAFIEELGRRTVGEGDIGILSAVIFLPEEVLFLEKEQLLRGSLRSLMWCYRSAEFVRVNTRSFDATWLKGGRDCENEVLILFESSNPIDFTLELLNAIYCKEEQGGRQRLEAVLGESLRSVFSQVGKATGSLFNV